MCSTVARKGSQETLSSVFITKDIHKLLDLFGRLSRCKKVKVERILIVFEKTDAHRRNLPMDLSRETGSHENYTCNFLTDQYAVVDFY